MECALKRIIRGTEDYKGQHKHRGCLPIFLDPVQHRFQPSFCAFAVRVEERKNITGGFLKNKRFYGRIEVCGLCSMHMYINYTFSPKL